MLSLITWKKDGKIFSLDSTLPLQILRYTASPLRVVTMHYT